MKVKKINIKIDLREDARQKDLSFLLYAESVAAENGDAKSVILLSNLIQKRLKKIQQFGLIECKDGYDETPQDN